MKTMTIVYDGRDGLEVKHPEAGKFKKDVPRPCPAGLAKLLLESKRGGFSLVEEPTKPEPKAKPAPAQKTEPEKPAEPPL